MLKDAAIQGEGYVAGANKPDTHLIGVAPGRDFSFEELDIRSVEAGDLAPGGQPIEIEPAIEVGQIFKLGTRYSEPLGATYLDEQGTERPIVMGSYGIGPARTVAAAIEQGADERGIVWPRSIAPWDVHLVGLGKGGDEVAAGGGARCTRSCGRPASRSCTTTGTPGRARSSPTPSCSGARCGSRSAGKTLAEGAVEAQARRTGAEERPPVAEAAARALELLDGLE